MGILKEKSVAEFLNLKDKELFNEYREAPKNIQKMMSNVYRCCYRFNLNNNQTLHMLHELIKPLKEFDNITDVLRDIFNN